jgi:hypothetical protein
MERVDDSSEPFVFPPLYPVCGDRPDTEKRKQNKRLIAICFQYAGCALRDENK